MIRQVLPPIHPDGWKFMAIAAAISLVLFLIWVPLGWLGLLVTIWIAFFFRDPWRGTPTPSRPIVRRADGFVVSLAPAPPPPELAIGAEPVPRVGIFLNLLDVHIARSPVGGTV